jgi:glycosyltransferase involved in cell wall biosynthesis
MILLCELSFLGRAHIPVNAGLLSTIHAAFPKEDISFYGANKHIEELKREVSQTLAGSITWREIVPPKSGTAYVRRFLSELDILRRLCGLLDQHSNSRLVLTSAYPSTVVALKIARGFRSKCRSMQVVLHGMSGVVGKRFRHPVRRFQDMKTALTLFGNKGVQYIVLEEAIRDTVVSNFPLLVGKIEALEHPISPGQAELPAINLGEPIRFGFLGLADKAKGFPVFLDVANLITAQYGSRAEFHAIGHASADCDVNVLQALATKPQNTLISRADFLASVARVHFIILPHDAESYTLTASGVLLDAIAWGKPVIARKIPIFESIFEKHGDIGYLFRDDKELKEIVGQILQAGDKSRYHRQILNLRDARKSRAPETLARAYRDICRKHG